MMGFISEFILPKEVDFNAALQNQAHISKLMVQQLYKACINDDPDALSAISSGALQARKQKAKNMKQLLDVFITPYDKESIYRIITELDWVALSVRHFQLEARVYDTHSLQEYRSIVNILMQMTIMLEAGIAQLSNRNVKPIATRIDLIHDLYNRVVGRCATATGDLLIQNDIKRILRHKDMLQQLKEIAKRIHIAANTLEDMAIKVV
ncbi:MAG TPA: hypothetical protein ENJ84_03165 [Gammaproteobacteria bacterium]|nr:hypothetical protein [Gammaproteobacteria bacterium]